MLHFIDIRCAILEVASVFEKYNLTYDDVEFIIRQLKSIQDDSERQLTEELPYCIHPKALHRFDDLLARIVKNSETTDS